MTASDIPLIQAPVQIIYNDGTRIVRRNTRSITIKYLHQQCSSVKFIKAYNTVLYIILYN
jgi:hypothetical protein